MGLTWLVWRFLKFFGLLLFGAGLWSAVTSPQQRTRLFAAHWIATAGLLLSWLAGYAILKASALEISSAWVLVTMAASLVALGGAGLAAEKTKASPFAAALVAAGATASVGAMVSRGSADLVLVGVAPLLAAAGGALSASRMLTAHEGHPDAVALTRRWFVWIARLEGTSLLVLLGIYLPIKIVFQVAIDGGQGFIGWVHGMLVLVYVIAWIAAQRAEQWSVLRRGAGFAASLFPLGTFVFERFLPDLPGATAASGAHTADVE